MNALQKFAASQLTKEQVMEYFNLTEVEVKEPAKFGQVLLAGEDEIYIYYPGEEALTAGDPVFSDEAGEEPLIAGEYPLADGNVLVVGEDGLVAEIIMPEDEVEDEAPADEQEAQMESAEEQAEEAAEEEAFNADFFKSMVEDLSSKYEALAEEFKSVKQERDEAIAKAEEFGKQSAATYKPHQVKTQPTITNFRNLSGAAKLAALSNKK